MRKTLISNPWFVASGGAMVVAVLLLALNPATGQQQETKPEAKDQNAKPAPTDKASSDRSSRSSRPRYPWNAESKPKSGEQTLEEMLSKALKDNPDIKVAEAKVREADAELNRTRLQVTQKVLAFHHNREAQKANVKVAEEEIARIRKLQASNVVAQEDVQQAEHRLSQAKAKLAEIEAELPYLVGEQAGKGLSFAFSPDGRWLATQKVRLWDPATGKQLEPVILGHTSVRFSPDGKRLLATGVNPVPSTTLDKIRKALDTPVKLDLQAVDAAGVLKDLERQVPGISFHVAAKTDIANLHIQGTISLGAALQLVEDRFTTIFEGGALSRCSFAIRDYGILFTSADRIPPGAIQLDDLLKERAAAEGEKKPAEKPSGALENDKTPAEKPNGEKK
jgi:hypothetical protein